MKSKIFVIIVLLSFTALFSQNKAVEKLKSTDSGIAIAQHRGMWSYAPENSIPALEYAIQFGAEIMETDIRLTKDNQLVIMHDYTVDRTTNGTGKVADLTLAEIKQLRLKEATGGLTNLQVPTLEEYIKIAKGRIVLYYDKAGYDFPNHQKGTLVKKILEVARKHDFLEESLFVLSWSYSDAEKIFGKDLKTVMYCPVIEDKIPNLDNYVNEYLQKLKPVAFQFRCDNVESPSYQQLTKVLKSGSKAFVAATWKHHTANHDDMLSLLEHPDKGWGWLVKQGFTILETNYLRDLDAYLKSKGKR